MKCPVCRDILSSGYTKLADHFIEEARISDASHIMWLNRNVSKLKTESSDLAVKLEEFFSLGSGGLKDWIIGRFVSNFFKEPPHLFIKAMQKPEREVLIGYVLEHHHFLKQWIKSCSYIMAKTDEEDVQMYELDNIMSEMHGFGSDKPSHHELLIRMGVDLGLSREAIMDSVPLEATRKAIDLWNRIALDSPWVETMAAMHSLELIATRGLEQYGADYPYFDPGIFESNELPDSVKAFLREGYEADASHSAEALDLVEKYSDRTDEVQHIQATFICSMAAFDDYLNARLRRGEIYED